jgi:hypothetical protein
MESLCIFEFTNLRIYQFTNLRIYEFDCGLWVVKKFTIAEGTGTQIPRIRGADLRNLTASERHRGCSTAAA